MCGLAALLSVALDSGNVVATEDGFQKASNIFIGTVLSENGRYITVTRGSDHWRFRTVLSRATQIENVHTHDTAYGCNKTSHRQGDLGDKRGGTVSAEGLILGADRPYSSG